MWVLVVQADCWACEGGTIPLWLWVMGDAGMIVPSVRGHDRVVGVGVRLQLHVWRWRVWRWDVWMYTASAHFAFPHVMRRVGVG